MEATNKLKFINRDVLKYLACLIMFIGHFVDYTISIEAFPFPVAFERACVNWVLMAPPVFMFFVAEGYHYTRDKKKYAIRMLIFSLITQIPYVLLNEEPISLKNILFSWNVILSLFFGLMCLIVWGQKWHIALRIFLMIACVLATLLFQSEWLVFAPIIIMLFYFLREKPLWRLLAYTLVMICHHWILMGGLYRWQMILATILPVIIITFFYNGKKGSDSKFNKYFFYVFYPGHLWLIYFARFIFS